MTIDSRPGNSGLRQECLSFPEVLAQSLGSVAPSTAPALAIPLVFASAGRGTWLAYLFAMVGLILVSLNIRQFARYSASPGSLYAYIIKGLGPTTGVISGLALAQGYLFGGMSFVAGFAIYADQVSSMFGIHVPLIVFCAICTGIAWFYAYTDIKLAAVIMLMFEFISLSLILLLAGIVLVKHGFVIDTSQLFLHEVSFEGVRFGLVLAVFSYVTFESAAVLGDEAKQPLLVIPRAVVWSLVLSGLFFIFLSYTEVLGFNGHNITLDKSDFPLNDLAEIVGVSWLGIVLSVGLTFSCFTCTLASFNAGARVLFAMARHHIFAAAIGRVHPKNQTPYVAVNLSFLAIFSIPAMMTLFGIKPLDIYGYLGSISTYGFLVVYVLISIAVPVYLHRLGKLRRNDVLISVLAVLFMFVPIVGSVYPVPPAPYSIFPYLFLLFLVIGGGWFFLLLSSSPQLVEDMQRDLEAVEKKFREPKVR